MDKYHTYMEYFGKFLWKRFSLLMTCVLMMTSSTGQSDPAQANSTRSTIRTTMNGDIEGYVYTLKSGVQVERYLGVPYATPPVGNLRFQKPEPISDWTGILPTKTLPAACIQEKLETKYIRGHNPYYDGKASEDCLYLNIYVPVDKSKPQGTHSLPILIHVHGGSNMVGMGGMTHGDVLASLGNMIVITINYRLCAFGFLFMPEFGLMGNYGLYDQNMAFKWVKDNAHFFGGDSMRVTVQGHSAGSVDVGFHLLSPKANGLFQQAILQSGSPTSFWALTFDTPEADDEARRRQNTQMLGCGGLAHDETVACLRSITTETIANKTYLFKEQIFNFSPAIDREYIPHHPYVLLNRLTRNENLDHSWKSVMIGVTKDEGSLAAANAVKNKMGKDNGEVKFTPPKNIDLWDSIADDYFTLSGLSKDLCKYMYTPWGNETDPEANIIHLGSFFGDLTFVAPAVELANNLSALKDVNIYFYEFSHISEQTKFLPWMGVPHGEDIFYLFGFPLEDSYDPNRTHTARDEAVSRHIINIWAQFIHGPGNDGENFTSQQASTYSLEEQQYLRIPSETSASLEFDMKRQLRRPYMQFWNDVVPKLKSQLKFRSQIRCSTDFSKATSFFVLLSLLCFFILVTIILFLYVLCKCQRKASS